MKTVSLYQRRLFAKPWSGQESIFSSLFVVDQLIDESKLLDKIDEQIVIFRSESGLWIGREIVGYDPQLKDLNSVVFLDFGPAQAAREIFQLDNLDDLTNIFVLKNDYKFLRGTLDISGKLTLDYFQSF